MPIAFLVTVVVSLNTRSRIPKGTARTMVRLHAPETLTAGLPEATTLRY
jgi:cation/acetate symporter